MDTQLGVARLRKEDVPIGKFHRKHSREFKIEAVKQVVEHGRSVAEVADGLGVNRNMLSRCKMDLLGVEGSIACSNSRVENRSGTP